MKLRVRDSLYAVVGAPVIAGRKLLDVGKDVSAKARGAFDESADQGRKVAEKVRKAEVVEELEERLDPIQDRVGKLRDQVEETLHHWRESFQPEPKKPARKPAKKPAATKAAEKPAADKPEKERVEEEVSS